MKKDELKEALRIEASIFVPNHRDQIKERVRLVATPKDKATSILKKMAPVLALGMLTIILTIVLPFLFKSPMAQYLILLLPLISILPLKLKRIPTVY